MCELYSTTDSIAMDFLGVQLHFTIGHNSRFANLPIEKQLERYIRDAKGDMIYDEYTEGRFHEWIIRSVSNEMINIAMTDIPMMETAMKDMDLSKEIISKYCNKDRYIKYWIKVKFLPLYKIGKKIKNILRSSS